MKNASLRITTGRFKQTKLFGPRNQKIRPAPQILRQAMINYLKDFLHKATVLDLYAGTGAIGLEMLSNGAYHTTFVDIAKQSIVLLENNINRCQVGKNSKIVHSDVMDFLIKTYRSKKEFDIIFVDPPYEKYDHQSEANRLDIIVELLDRIGALLSAQSVLIVKHPATFKIPLPNRLSLYETRTYGFNSLSYIMNKQNLNNNSLENG